MSTKVRSLKKLKPRTPLEREVVYWLEGKDDPEVAMEDLLSHGCQTGMVGHLIYDSDTVSFYEKHREYINIILSELVVDGSIQGPQDLQGWDREDPLGLDTTNKNLLAWFGFEEAARRLSEDWEIRGGN